jgi:tetratricopeptide (TPR) repeat protein
VKALTDFRTAHKGTASAATAALPLGKAEFRLGNHDGALAAFADYLKGAPQNDPLRAAALEGQGYAYEAQQKYDQALGSFEEMSKVDAGGYLEGMGQYHRARILILQGKKDDAATVLVKIPVDHPGTAAARLSAERTALLSAEGVKIPEPPEPAGGPKDGGA